MGLLSTLCMHACSYLLSATCPMQLQHSFPTTLGGSVAGLSRIYFAGFCLNADRAFLYNELISNFDSNMLTRSMSLTI